MKRVGEGLLVFWPVTFGVALVVLLAVGVQPETAIVAPLVILLGAAVIWTVA